METIKTYAIEDFDLISHRGKIYQARKKVAGISCSSQCSLFNHYNNRCDGLCWRYPDGDRFVFKLVNEHADSFDYDRVKETPWAEKYDRKLAEMKGVLKKLRKMKGGE